MMSIVHASIRPYSVPVNPHWVPFGGYPWPVNAYELKKLLAENLDTAIGYDAGRRGERLKHEDIAAKAKVGKGTVGRIARGDTTPAVDTLESVARVFGLHAWQMIAGPLDPAHPPELLTPALRQELTELRAIKAQLEELARGGVGSFKPPGLPGGDGTSSTADRESVRNGEPGNKTGRPRG